MITGVRRSTIFGNALLFLQPHGDLPAPAQKVSPALFVGHYGLLEVLRAVAEGRLRAAYVHPLIAVRAARHHDGHRMPVLFITQPRPADHVQMVEVINLLPERVRAPGRHELVYHPTMRV